MVKKPSIKKDEIQGAPLMKAKVLDVYSDIFTGIGKFPSEPYKFQLKPNAKSTRHAPRKVLTFAVFIYGTKQPLFTRNHKQH